MRALWHARLLRLRLICAFCRFLRRLFLLTSFADVLLHAISDALLGAAALGDIGRHFPDTDPRYEGADSMKLLAEVRHLLEAKGYRIGNVDATIVAQKPKMKDFIPQMNENIAQVLGVSLDDVNVKATT